MANYYMVKELPTFFSCDSSKANYDRLLLLGFKFFHQCYKEHDLMEHSHILVVNSDDPEGQIHLRNSEEECEAYRHVSDNELAMVVFSRTGQTVGKITFAELDDMKYRAEDARELSVDDLPDEPQMVIAAVRMPRSCQCGAHATSTPQIHSEWCPEYAPKFRPERTVAMHIEQGEFEQYEGRTSSDEMQMDLDGIEYGKPTGPDFRPRRASISDWERAIARSNNG